MPSTIQFYNTNISAFNRLQNQLFETQSKIGADTLADTFSELGGNINLVQELKTSLSRTNRFVESIDEVSRKVDSTFRAVDNIIDYVSEFKQTLTLENSSSAPKNNLTVIADTTLDQIRGSLNSKEGQNYLFAGSKTSSEPVSDLKLNSNVVNGAVTANYYSGDGFKASLDVNNTVNVEYGITAADNAFRKTIAAINLAKGVESGTSDIVSAGELLDEAFDELIDLRAGIGNNQKIMDDIKEQHEKSILKLEQDLSEINSPDIIELTIRSSQNEATLTAAFQTFARVSNLSITNFL